MIDGKRKLVGAHAFLDGGGETGALIRAFDWSTTPLGTPETWPQPLKTLVTLMLASDQAMFVTWGPEHTIIYNDDYAPMLADRHPGGLGHPIFEVWHEIRADIEPMFDQVFAGKAVRIADSVFQMDRPGRPSEAHFNFSYTPVRDEDGVIRGLFCVTTETTEQIFAERAQRAAETSERYRLWTLSEDMLARANYEGMMTAVSPAWTAVLGWDEPHLLATPYADFMHGEDEGVTLAAIAEMGRTGRPTRFRNRIARSDGGWTPIEWTVAPEPDGAHFIAVGRDLTETVAREEELALTQEALRQSQKMEAVGQLTGGVAHDFNNLLTPIIGTLDTLLQRGIGTERERPLIEGALQSADRAKLLVQRLLAFARRQPLQPTAVDLGELAHSIIDLLTSTLGPDVRVTVDVADDLPAAQADRNQLEMALLNLGVNAGDAMPEGGELTVSVTGHTVGSDHATELPPGHYVRLAVRDTGIGMDEETRLRAIEPFYSTKGVGKGTGLGLSMVHGLAAQLGGVLTIESAPGVGSTIALWLPASSETVAPGDAAASPAPLPTLRGKVLLVDDEVLIRMSSADLLSDMDYDVVEAGSAEAALALIEDGLVPDLLITDHLMPGMNGETLARTLLARWPQLPVLIVSGYAQSDGIAPDLPRLTKPFRGSELAASLAQLQPT